MWRRTWSLCVATAVVTAVTASIGSSAQALPNGPRECTTSGAATHLVVAGDTWFRIAIDAGVSLSGLLTANSADELAIIHPGDELCLPADAPAPPTTPAPACSGYTVILDDSWFLIAKKNKVAMIDLLAANGAGVETALQPGMQLCLPAATTPPTTSTTTTSTTTTTSAPASCGGSTYTVITDDSWFLIAKKAATTMRALLDANDATERTGLMPGDVLCLPKQAVVAASPSSGGLRALPVQGPCWYTDTWHAPRGGERRHEGVDLMTKSGQYVYAVTDGTLAARAWDQPGLRAGNAWWLKAADGTYYFYAHLSGFAQDLKVGSKVVAGQIIGFVGSTGNAAGPHLHFEVHPHGGAAVNPYPLVKAAGGCAKD